MKFLSLSHQSDDGHFPVGREGVGGVVHHTAVVVIVTKAADVTFAILGEIILGSWSSFHKIDIVCCIYLLKVTVHLL